MRQKTLRVLAILSVLALTLVGCMMRYYQLETIFDETGLPRSGSPVTWMLSFLSMIVVLECVLTSWALPRARHERELFRPDRAAVVLGLLSALALAAGSIVAMFGTLRSGGLGLALLEDLLQLLAAACVAAAAWRRWKGERAMPLLHAVICLWQVLLLLLNFKNWSMDPVILDYCFRLFALICGMCATYHVGTFGFGRGARRLTAFWCLAGCYFALVSAVGEDPGWQLMALGIFLWLLCNAWQLFDQPGAPAPEAE